MMLWEPSTIVERDAVSESSLGLMCALLDWPAPADGRAATAPDAGATLPTAPDGEVVVPPLWHWLAFRPSTAQQDLAPDGHARRGGFLPATRETRRMIGGGRVRFDGRLRPGVALTRRSRVEAVEPKQGRSGRFTLVTVRYEIASGAEDADEAAAGLEGSGCPLVTEEVDLAYREPAPAGGESRSATAEEPGPRHATWMWQLDLECDPRLLFRFSALTYNAHRIHYDRAWATEVEGYPGLVVHGPLQAVALAELCRRHAPQREVRTFEYRAIAPKFDDGPLLARGRPDGGGGAVLCCFDQDGVATMRARVLFSP